MLKKFVSGLVILCALLWVSPVFADESLPYVEPSACPVEVPGGADIECGVLIAPEDYEKPEGNLVRMPYIIIHAKNAGADATPLLFTEGGPGGNSLQAVEYMADTVLVEDRDVIIFQQRGNLYAEPALACEFNELYDDQLGNSPCKQKFESADIALTQYHTAIIAEDIESLRVALGYEQWNLWGSSYSTRLMQVLMDRHPEGIRSVILQSVSPLHETRYQHDPEHSYQALQVMFEDCAIDPDCAAAYPDLEQRFFDLVAEFNRNPIKLELEDPVDDSPYPYEVTGSTLISWMVGRAFYGPAHLPYTTAYYPLLIDHLSAGETNALTSWAQNELNNDLFDPGFIAYGLYFVVNCQDDAVSVTREQFDAQSGAYPEMGGYYRHQREWDLCQFWGLPSAPPLSDGPISSEIPTLVLAGRYDPITPPEWSQMVADHLTNSYYVEFPSKGHSIDSGSGCGLEIKRSFLLDPQLEPDTSCLADEPPPMYVLPSDTLPAAGFTRSIQDIDYGVPERGVPAFEVLTFASNLIFLLEVVVFLVLSVLIAVCRSDRKERARRFEYRTHLLAAVTSLLSIGVVVFMSLVNQSTESQFLRMLGLIWSTPLTTALGIVVWGQMLATVVLLVGLIQSWIRKESSLFNHIALTLVGLGAVTFWPFYFRWDLVKIVLIKLGF